MMRYVPFSFLVLSALGCTKYIVRDAAVYQAELNQYDAWATKQATLLRGFVATSCTCNESKEFTTPECSQAADYILTIESRAPWHKSMSLYLAGLSETRPAQEPPLIPANSTLCK